MKQFLKEEEHADAYLEKPIGIQEMTALMRLVDLT